MDDVMDAVQSAATVLSRLASQEADNGITVDIAELIAEQSKAWAARLDEVMGTMSGKDDGFSIDFESEAIECSIKLAQMNGLALMLAMGGSDYTDTERYELGSEEWRQGLSGLGSDLMSYLDIRQRYLEWLHGGQGAAA